MNHLDHLIIKLQAAMGFKTSDESHLELLKSYNAELRRSPERFSSADVWTEWNRAVHGIVEQLNGVQKDLIDGQTSNSEVQVLSQYLQIARNLCAGGAHHQKSLRCGEPFLIVTSFFLHVISVFIPDLIQPTLDATVRISGIPSLRADGIYASKQILMDSTSNPLISSGVFQNVLTNAIQFDDWKLGSHPQDLALPLTKNEAHRVSFLYERSLGFLC